MKRESKTKPEPPKKQAALEPVMVKVILALLADLAMNEDRASRVARLALRAHRDGVKLSDAERAGIMALVSAVGRSMDKAEKDHAFTQDARGNHIFNLDLPSWLRDEPEAQRATTI
jgi:hypothetical protein